VEAVMLARPMRLAAILLVGALPALAAPDPLREALDRLQQRYESTRTLSMDFRQTVESATLATPLTTHGTVAFEKPNRMRWNYAAPDEQVIVGDGDTLWIYQPADKQVIKAPLGEAFRATTPVTFLAGLGKVERDFEASLERDEPDRWVVRLVPRQDAGIGALRLTVLKKDAAIAEAQIVDPLGTTTRIAFSNERRNIALDAALFRFTPPPGVDVVRPPAY
jgi:outer membrane lipoprotein carrier protein